MVKKVAKKPPSGKPIFNIRMEPTMRAALEKAADDEANTPPGIVRLAVRDWLRARGYLK
jgi:hypothetical protein